MRRDLSQNSGKRRLAADRTQVDRNGDCRAMAPALQRAIFCRFGPVNARVVSLQITASGTNSSPWIRSVSHQTTGFTAPRGVRTFTASNGSRTLVRVQAASSPVGLAHISSNEAPARIVRQSVRSTAHEDAANGDDPAARWDLTASS
jgi:hypothetical protein